MTELLKDILREPEELTRSLEFTLGPGRKSLDKAAALVRQSAEIIVTGIGSSWHAGMAVESLFGSAGRHVHLVDASEFLHFYAITKDSTLIVLSRSGKSVEVVNLLEKATEAGAKVIAVSNTPESPLAKAANATLWLEAAFDHNVSITMYSALGLVGGLLARAAHEMLEADLATRLSEALRATQGRISAWQEQLEEADWLAPAAPVYFLARGGSLASCHEARLLWEEAAKAPAAAMTTGGFRHGPQECVFPGSRIGLWMDGQRLRMEDLALVADLRRLGAKAMLIGQNVPDGAADLVFQLPPIPSEWQFLIDIVPTQLAAERLARLRGVDCDSFRICPYIIEKEGGLVGSSRPS